MPHEEKTVSSQTIFTGRVISLRVDEVILENGRQAKREVVDHPGGVCVLPLNENGEVTLVRQFRYPYREELLEIPAGKRDHGEDPLECGKRELEEETGLRAAQYVSLGELYPSPGYFSEVIYLYLATGLTKAAQRLDEDEFLDICTMPLAEAVEQTLQGKIKDAKTQVALLKTYALTIERQ